MRLTIKVGFVYLCFFLLGKSDVQAQLDSTIVANKVNSSLIFPKKPFLNKASIITGSSFISLGSLFVFMNNSWWTNNAKSFHFDNGRDLRYANNLDKMGHLMGGIIAADAYYDVGKWVGMSDKKAAWFGFAMGTGIQTVIEIKDGFSPKWGFSILDITTGSFGALMPVLKQKSSFFRNSDFKFSYLQRTDKYFKTRSIPITFFDIDDYLNQTYWMSTNLRYLAGQENTWIPDWLCISIGWGIEAASWNINPNDPGTGGRPEFYLAPDIDLVKLFKPKKMFWKQTLKRLNYLKFPMPAIQLTQTKKAFPLYY